MLMYIVSFAKVKNKTKQNKKLKTFHKGEHLWTESGEFQWSLSRLVRIGLVLGTLDFQPKYDLYLIQESLENFLQVKNKDYIEHGSYLLISIYPLILVAKWFILGKGLITIWFYVSWKTLFPIQGYDWNSLERKLYSYNRVPYTKPISIRSFINQFNLFQGKA